jgi:ribA/ribD-fused uncharacterized protein
MRIEQFRGEYFFLSNMYALHVPILALCGVKVPTSEHVYMSGRFKDPEIQLEVAKVRAPRDVITPYAHGLAVKNFAHRLIDQGHEQLPNWDTSKLELMYTAVARKFFRNSDIAAALNATGNKELIEGNDWGDRFWGVDPVGSQNGENHLGKILMQVRSELAAPNV